VSLPKTPSPAENLGFTPGGLRPPRHLQAEPICRSGRMASASGLTAPMPRTFETDSISLTRPSLGLAPQGSRRFHPRKPRRSGWSGRGPEAARQVVLRNACFLCAGSPVERSPAPNRDRALPARIAREIAVDDVATRGPNTIYEADFVKAVRPAPKSSSFWAFRLWWGNRKRSSTRVRQFLYFGILSIAGPRIFGRNNRIPFCFPGIRSDSRRRQMRNRETTAAIDPSVASP
jgi:hypothetical protein